MSTAASTMAVRPRGRPRAAFTTVCTWILVAQLALSGGLLLARPAFVMTVVRHLGYPDYFPVVLGVAKLLGAMAIARASGVVTEWAYAGATFDVLAVVASHAALGDAVGETLAPLGVLAVIVVSYAGFHQRKEDA
jgi:hypothetical protein